MTTSKHKWHLFDEKRGLYCRQATNRLRKNRWEVKLPSGEVVTLTDEEFGALRCEGPNPKGL